MVVGVERRVGPPSTMRGIWLPSCSKTLAGGTLGHSEEVGGGCGDGQAESVDDGAGDGCLGDAQGDVAGVGGDAQGKAGSGLDDEGEGAGPESLGEAVECGVDLAGEAIGLCGVADEQGERLVAGAALELVDAVNGAQVDGIDGQAIEGVSGQRDDAACGERATTRAINSGSGSSGWMRSISAVKGFSCARGWSWDAIWSWDAMENSART